MAKTRLKPLLEGFLKSIFVASPNKTLANLRKRAKIDDMSDVFTQEIPTETGDYEINLNGRLSRAQISYRAGVLWLHGLIECSLSDYYYGYDCPGDELSWRKLEGDEISGCADDQKFGFV